VDDDDGAAARQTRGTTAGFDPLRRLADAQRLAVETADASFRAFTRFLGTPDVARRPSTGEPEPDGDADDEPGFAELRRSVTRSFDLYLELAERMFDSSTRSMETALRVRGVTVTGQEHQPPWIPVRVEGEPGTRPATTAWLHNMTEAALDHVELRSTGLASFAGATIPAASVRLSPAALEQVAAGSTVSVAITVDLPSSLPAGTYAGYVLTTVPDAVLPLLVDVRARHPGTNGDGPR
jgi:hypothetical protein